MTPHTVQQPYIRFTGTSGYTRHGDTVSLFADHIDNLNNGGITSDSLSLQLWACQWPYSGGDLTGWKVAETSLGVLQPGQFLASIDSTIPASFPEFGDFAMTLVIAEWDGKGFNLIHDFHTYPDRDVFIQPCLEGKIGYRFVDDQHLVVEVERIRNPRNADNVSGTLSLECWALPGPYLAGDFQGHAMGGTTLGTLAGGESWANNIHEIEIVLPPPDTYTLVLMLREWTGNGYVTRDHCNFNRSVTFPLSLSITQTGEPLMADRPGEPITNKAELLEQTGEAVPTEGAAYAAPQPAAPTPQNTRQTSAPQTRDSASDRQNRFDALKRSALRLWEWIKRHW